MGLVLGLVQGLVGVLAFAFALALVRTLEVEVRTFLAAVAALGTFLAAVVGPGTAGSSNTVTGMVPLELLPCLLTWVED